MPCDNHINSLLIVNCPVVESLIRFIGTSRVVGGTVGSLNPNLCMPDQNSPTKKLGYRRTKSTTLGIRLVAVPQKDVVVKDRGLVNTNSWKQSSQRGRALPPFQVVVPPDLDVSRLFRIRIVEFGQLLINGSVGDIDLIKMSCFSHSSSASPSST